MRVLFLAGYENAAYQRKVDLLADDPAFEVLVVNSGGRLAAGQHASANGRRSYQLRPMRQVTLGRPGDPHRQLYWPGDLGLRYFQADLIHCEFEQESLGAAQVVLARRWWAPRAALTLYAYQNILRPRGRAVRALSAYTRQAAQAVVCASEEAAEVLRRQGYAGRTPVLPALGVDPRCFHPGLGQAVRGRFGLSATVIGYVGRLVPEKDVGTLLQAAAQLPPDVSILVVGDGPARPQLEALAGQLGLAKRCHFTGAVDYAQLPEYMGALDVLVLPSRTRPNWKEQFGRVLVEAMACGVVVVGSDSGSIPEVIDAAGRLFPEGAAEPLAQVLAELAAQPQLRAALAQRGLARVQERYAVERVADSLGTLWRELAP